MQYRRGFSLVELLVVITILGVLSTVAYLAIGNAKSRSQNNRMTNDLLAISNALEQYKRDHFGKYPIPQPGSQQNVSCYDAATQYVHDCDAAAFIQGMIDNALLTKRYLSEIPLDPRTGSRYAYGVTRDGQYFMVAGLYQNEDGTYSARTVENLSRGSLLPSLIRAYNGPHFVLNEKSYLPYNPNLLEVTATLENVNGEVRSGSLNSCDDLSVAASGAVVHKGEKICTGAGASVDLYFSDGSFSRLEGETEIELPDLSMLRNDGESTVTQILIRLKAGKLWSKVVRLAAESEFRVETTGMIAGVRGTEFSVDAAGSVLVKSGSVWVSPDKSVDTKLEAFSLPVIDSTNDAGEYAEPAGFIPLLNNNLRPHLLLVDGVNSLIQIKAPGAFKISRVAAYVQNGSTPVATVPVTYGNADITLPILDLNTLKDVRVRLEEMRGSNIVRASAFSDPAVTVNNIGVLTEKDLYPQLIVAAPAIETPQVNSAETACAGKGYWDGTGCWVMGDVNQNCTQACSTKANLACVVDNPDTPRVNEGFWNVDSTICNALGVSNPTVLGTSSSTNIFAPYKSSNAVTTQCRIRAMDTNFSCDQFVSDQTTQSRICYCQ